MDRGHQIFCALADALKMCWALAFMFLKRRGLGALAHTGFMSAL